MNNKTHSHLNQFERSATLAINERSAEMADFGQTIYRFRFGQSPFPVPDSIVAALQEKAFRKNYLPVEGLYELRQAIADYHQQKDELDINTDGVLIARGSKELTPEKAFNLSAGVSANFSGLRLSVDVYSITITDRIVMTGNFSAGDSDLGIKIKELLKLSGVPEATSGRFFFNGVDTKTNGLDIVAVYSMDLAALGNLDLSFAYNTTTTEITEVRYPEKLKDVLNADGVLYPDGTDDEDKDGLNGSPLLLEENAGSTWIDWTRTYTNPEYDAENPDPDVEEFITDHESVQVLGNKTLVDLEVGYDLGLVTLSAGANNLFDVMPEKGAQPGAGNGGLSPFGMNGRFVYTKLFFNF